MGSMECRENINVAQRRKDNLYVHSDCCFTRRQWWLYTLPKVLNNREVKARWNPYCYLLKILLNCLELAEPFFSRCTHQVGWDRYQLSLADVFCGIGERLRPGWKLAVQRDSSGEIEK